MKVTEDVFIKKLFFKLGTGSKRIERSVYVTLIKGKENCLIDTGTAHNFKDIVNFCEKKGVPINDLDIIINTHCHPDHIGSNYLFKKANPKIILYAHSLAKPYIEDIEKQYKERPVPGFFNLIAGSVKIDRSLQDCDIVDMGTELKIFHTPGHSAGSISIFIPEKDVLIIGDAVPGKKDVPIYENVNILKKSFLKLQGISVKHVISSFDGYCNGISEVITAGEELIDKIDKYVQEYLDKFEIYRENVKIQDLDLEEICSFVLEKLSFKDHTPIYIIVESIKSHVMNFLFSNYFHTYCCN